MNYLSIDYLIVYAFLAITLIIGLRAGRGIKDIREYAIANKTFGTGALVLTYLATNIAGASVIDTAAMVYSEGSIITIALLGVGFSFLITGLFIVPKVASFDHCLTMGDLMKNFYGSYSGIIAGLLGLLNAVLLVGMEMHVLGIICESLLGIKAEWGTIAGGITLAIYSAHGGIKAVTMTDIFQFVMLVVFIPLIAYVAVGKVGGIPALLQQVPTQKLAILSHQDFSFYLTLFLMWIIPAGLIDPALIQRLLMAKKGEQLRNQHLIMAAFDPTFQLVIMLIGLSAVVLYPHIEGKQVVAHLIHELLPVGAQGLAIAGVLAVGMSTIDSYLHAAGLTLTHDVIKPICDKKNKQINELKWARYTTVLIGIVGICIGLKATDIMGLAFNALQFVSPLLMFPLLSGIMGLKTDKRSFYTALVVTLIAFVVAKLSLPSHKAHLSVLITMVANGLTFFGMHIFQNKGFAIKNNHGQEVVWKPHKKDFLSILKTVWPTPKLIVAYSQNKVATYGAPYVLFGVFALINYILPYFIWMQTPPQYETLMLYLRLIGGILCVLLIVQEKWAEWLLPYIPTFWHLTILYCLPFTSTVMFLLTGDSVEWVVNIFGVIILLLVLLDWVTAIIVGILGICLGLFFYKLFVGSLAIPLSFSAKYLMVYQGIFGILIGLLFARRKQQRFDQLATDNQILTITKQEDKEALLETFKEKIRLLQTLKQAGIQNLSQVVKLVRELRTQGKETFKEAQPLNQILQQLENTVTPMAVSLERIENRATDYLRLDIKPIAIDKLLEAVQEHLPNQPLHYKIHTEYLQITCDPTKLIKMLVQGIVALQADKEAHQSVYIGLQDTKLAYPIYSLGKNYAKQISAIGFSLTLQSHIAPLEASYKAQMNGSSLPMPATTQELLLITNQRIIKAHYGYTNIDLTQKTNYDTYLYVLPVDLSEIRPRDMNDPYMELGMSLVRADDTYPGAKEQEQDFLAAVQQKSQANLEVIKTALEVIKWYHGAKNRHSGEPFYLHPLAVAQIVLEYNQDEATILGALLHDTVEDTAMLLENIEMMFGPDVVKIVDGVTHFESIKESFYKIKLSIHENILMLLDTEDKRALYVKIADRMHNIRTIEGHRSPDKKKQIAEETLQFFVPLAQGLGLEQAVAELKARSAKILNISDQQ